MDGGFFCWWGESDSLTFFLRCLPARDREVSSQKKLSSYFEELFSSEVPCQKELSFSNDFSPVLLPAFQTQVPWISLQRPAIACQVILMGCHPKNVQHDNSHVPKMNHCLMYAGLGFFTLGHDSMTTLIFVYNTQKLHIGSWKCDWVFATCWSKMALVVAAEVNDILSTLSKCPPIRIFLACTKY